MVNTLKEKLQFSKLDLPKGQNEFTAIPSNLLQSIRAKLEKALALPSEAQLTIFELKEPTSESTDFFPEFNSPSATTSAAE